MNVEITYHEMTDAAKEYFADYLGKKLHRLEKMLASHSPDTIALHARVSHYERHNAFDVTLQLEMLEEKDCYSQEVSHNITKAIDLAMDRLEIQLTKLLDKQKRV